VVGKDGLLLRKMENAATVAAAQGRALEETPWPVLAAPQPIYIDVDSVIIVALLPSKHKATRTWDAGNLPAPFSLLIMLKALLFNHL